MWTVCVHLVSRSMSQVLCVCDYALGWESLCDLQASGGWESGNGDMFMIQALEPDSSFLPGEIQETWDSGVTGFIKSGRELNSKNFLLKWTYSKILSCNYCWQKIFSEYWLAASLSVDGMAVSPNRENSCLFPADSELCGHSTLALPQICYFTC